MSKIAEKKALEVYPPENGTLYQRLGYVKGYDQAIQDFMKKAEDAISMIGNHYVGEDYSFEQIWERFKQYMEDE